MANLTFSQVNSVLKYDAETGLLYWRARTMEFFHGSKWGPSQSCAAWNAKYAGKEALTANKDGYKSGSVFNQKVRAHRVAWLLHYGAWPTMHIDHINGDRADNRIVNLRDVSRSINQKNMKSRSDNTSGVTGVYFCAQAKKWKAEIFISGRKSHIGTFASFDAATNARSLAEVQNGYTCRK